MFVTESMVGHKLGEFAPTRHLPRPLRRPQDRGEAQVMAAVETRSEVRAEARYVRAAPAQGAAGRRPDPRPPVPEARTILAFMTRDAARDVRKVLDSAVANAEANHGLDSDELYVVGAYVGAGPTLKRWQRRARGRVGRIKKRTCHITIALAQPGGEAIPAPIERPAPVDPDRGAGADRRRRDRRRRGGGRRRRGARRGEAGRRRDPRPRCRGREAGGRETAAAEAEEQPKPKRTRAAKPKAERLRPTSRGRSRRPRGRRRPQTTETDEGSES